MKQGGKRKGAGRPKNTGKYLCKTRTMRVPAHLIPKIKIFIEWEMDKEKVFPQDYIAKSPTPMFKYKIPTEWLR